MVSYVINWVTLVLVVLTMVGFVLMVLRPNHERHEEDAARAFFDRHGHWPDEPGP